MKITITIALLVALINIAPLAPAQTTPVNIPTTEYNTLNFYAGLLNEDVSTLIQNILSTFAPQYKTVTWSQFTTAPTVSVSLLDESSTSPATYDLVRVLATSTVNSGSFSWIPQSTDSSPFPEYVEIGCVFSSSACQAFSLIPQ